MSTEVRVPWMLDEYGNIATTQDPNVQVMQHVKSLVATEPGERVMRPEYGVPTREFVFSPGPNRVSDEIRQAVATQMAMWEPTINIIDIIASPSSSQGVAPIEVDFTQTYTPSQTYTAVIQVGGTVVDVSES